MGAMPRFQALRQYQNAGVLSVAATATPEQLIAMLLGGALDRIAHARGAARNGDHATRRQKIGSAIAILEYLRLCIDRRGGAMADRLDALYDFSLRRLTQANAAEDPSMLEEVSEVIRPLKTAWDEIRPAGAAR